MKSDGHRRKAERLERTMQKLDDDADYETIIEASYAAAVHYIAFISERRKKKHLDTHKGLAKFLDETDLGDLATPFREVELLRTAKYYGGQGNGKSAWEARRILAEIKTKLH